ncbi:MAG: YibE/F family protein, partial [Spirochaetes bacterium]|nr:YibE/F family protein [Spirochaetota bacterium]
IIFILIPLIFQGYDPILFSILILSVIVIVSFFIIAGFSRKTIAAIIGTIGGIIFAGLISYFTSNAAKLSGINMEKGEQILYLAKDFNIRIKGILFISILIASLGAIMDVAMSIASAINEIKIHKPEISSRELFQSGMNIGHDMISTMINTLILAFAGSSFTLLLMIAGFHMDFKQFINIPVISIEIIQAISGSIGILLTVPFTNIATIFLLKRKELQV